MAFQHPTGSTLEWDPLIGSAFGFDYEKINPLPKLMSSYFSLKNLPRCMPVLSAISMRYLIGLLESLSMAASVMFDGSAAGL